MENARFSPRSGHAIHMGPKHCILLAALVVAFLGGIVWLLVAPSEPAYGGKPLSAWLAEYNHQSLNWPRTFNTPVDEAVRHIGTNAFPMISRRLRYQDSALKVKFFQFLHSYLHLHFPFQVRHQSEYNAQAVAAMCALGRDAKPLIPTLAESLGHMELGTRANAGFWLESLGSDGEAAVPALIQMLKDKSDRFRCFIVETLAAVGGEQIDRVLPVLEECLKDSDAVVRFQAKNELSLPPWVELKAMDDDSLTRKNRESPTPAAKEKTPP